MSEVFPPVAIIIPVHNRRETTVACLRNLREQGLLSWATPIVVDAGSTDGTRAAVASEFPGTEIVAADDGVFWTGAIQLGMQRAKALGAEYLFWLNDDTVPQPGAINRLLEESRRSGAITGGVCFLAGESEPAYGGLRKTWRGLQMVSAPGSAIVACDVLHGNMVCIPAAVVTVIGYPDSRGLPHAGADFDYCLRARRAGLPVLLVGAARASGHANLSLNYRSWLLSDVPVIEWWRQLGRRGSYSNLLARWVFHWRHWRFVGMGQVVGMLVRLLLISVVRLLVPLPWLRRIYGRHSQAWQHEGRHRLRP